MSRARRRLRLVPLALALVVGGTMTAQHGCGGREQPPAQAKTPSIVLIVIDTLRSDALCGRAGEPADMPATHALAKKGVLFPNAVAPAPWTLPSVSSLLTGLKPRGHGLDRMEPVPLYPGPVKTWAQVLESRGYQTAAYSGSPFSWAVPGGVLKGFRDGRIGMQLLRMRLTLESWRRSLDPSRPFFLLLHFYEAHDPYGERNQTLPGQPPPPPLDPEFRADRVTEGWEVTRYFMLDWTTRQALIDRMGRDVMYDTLLRYLWTGYREAPRPSLAAELREAYVGGTRWVDGQLGQIYAWLEKEHVLDDAVLALAADHGEAFGEHGTLEHGRVLYDEVVRVPLVLLGPGALGGGKVVTSNVSLLDVMPTLFEAARQPLPPGVEGSSLVPVIEGREAGRIAEVQEQVDHVTTKADIDWSVRALRSNRWKAILTWDRRTGAVREEAYDLAADPGEHADLAQGRGTLAGLAFDTAFCRELDRVRADLRAEGATAPLPASCAK
jgi:arylsulfatase A-like enzyme